MNYFSIAYNNNFLQRISTRRQKDVEMGLPVERQHLRFVADLADG